MPGTDSTCWTVIEGAARGHAGSRDDFARRYLPVVRAYLCARWRGSFLAQAVEDAIQEVFLDCFREGGALARVDRDRGAFLPFLYGVVRNVAHRVESRRARSRERQPDTESQMEAIRSREENLSALFDRAWALSLLHQAAERLASPLDGADPGRSKRAELLRLRFEGGLPIREIAQRWGEDPARVHKDYARARREFRDALFEVVAFHLPGPADRVRRECARLLAHFQ